MVSRLRLCNATQSARASASATVVIASTSTASCSPKIKVDVIGSKPNASPKGFGRSPTMAFPGEVKMFTLSVFDATGAVMPWSLSVHLCRPLSAPFDVRATVRGKIGRSATTNPLDEGIDPYQSIGWPLRCTACAGARRQPRASMIMPKRAMLVQRFWSFLKFGRQRVDIDFSFVGHGTVNSRRAPEVHCAHGEIQNEHRRCSFHIVLEAAQHEPDACCTPGAAPMALPQQGFQPSPSGLG